MMIGLNLSVVRGFVPGGFEPADLFANGEDGALIQPSTSTAFTDTGGTTPATAGDPVARINDASGNGNNATQATLGNRPEFQGTDPYYLSFDGTDDNFSIPLGANFTGDFALILDTGPIFGSIDTGVSTTWGYTVDARYIPDGRIHALLVVDRALTASERADIVAFYADAVTTAPTTAASAFRDRTDLTSLDLDSTDWSGVTDASQMCRFCTGLLTGPKVSGMTAVTNGTATFDGCSAMVTPPEISTWAALQNASFLLRDCSSMTTPPDVTGWASVANTTSMAQNCSALTSAFDLSGWNPLGLTNGTNFMANISAAGFDQTAYDAALIAWDAAYDLTAVNTLSINFGSATYGAGAATTARNTLAANGWTITDGGAA